MCRLGGDGAKWYKEGTVDSTSIEKEFSTHFLYELLAFLVKEGSRGGFFCILFACSILDGSVGKRLVLVASLLVLEYGKGFFDVTGHEKMDLVVG